MNKKYRMIWKDGKHQSPRHYFTSFWLHAQFIRTTKKKSGNARSLYGGSYMGASNFTNARLSQLGANTVSCPSNFYVMLFCVRVENSLALTRRVYLTCHIFSILIQHVINRINPILTRLTQLNLNNLFYF